jgi:5-methylcytosine-specific restriction endonuclease McrA
MTHTYKVITTVTWKFESDQPENTSLEHAKSQLDKILDTHPQGEEFEGFCVQVDLAKMKDRKRLIHLGDFSLDDVLPYITEEESKRDYHAKGKDYSVRMNSERYFVFKRNHKCVACGLEGSKMILDINPGDQSPHFNLYAEENGRLVLMTKDHVLAKSKGGNDELSNYCTCCCICNNLKGNYDLNYAQVRELRHLYNNEEKLPRKELRDLINKRREEMASKHAKEDQ